MTFVPINRQNLSILYSHDFGYSKQSLVFAHKDSLYTHEVNPNVLLWKDGCISPWSLSNNLSGVAKISWEGSVFSADGSFLGKVDISNVVGKPKGFVKISMTDIAFNTDRESVGDPQMVFSGLSLNGFKGYSKALADPFSHYLMQHRLKYDALTLE